MAVMLIVCSLHSFSTNAEKSLTDLFSPLQPLGCSHMLVCDVRLTGGRVRVSLKQAIEIHAKVLKHRFGCRAPELARENAESCSKYNDHEGRRVWMDAVEAVELLL